MSGWELVRPTKTASKINVDGAVAEEASGAALNEATFNSKVINLKVNNLKVNNNKVTNSKGLLLKD
jgi:hypothetical protein